MYKPYANEDTRSSILSGIRDSAAQEAWSRFFDRYAGFIYSVARDRGLKNEDADEIVQTILVELAKPAPDGIAAYDRSKGGFRPWLIRRIEWRVADFLRRKQVAEGPRADIAPETLERLPDPAVRDAADSAYTEEWAAAAEEEALRRLRDDVGDVHFAVYHASVIEGKPTNVVCGFFHIQPNNLYQIRRRVKLRYGEILAEVLKDFEDPDV